jgi:predicted HTH domain antitoxin
MAQIPVHTISIDVPKDVFLALNETESELKQRLRVALAVQLYALQKLTVGKAAQLAGLSRLRFENLLSDNAIAISNLTMDDVMDDISRLQ